MDKLAEQLKNDAALIDVEISSQLDHRIAASLHGITPELPGKATSAQRPAIFWWASSLTGIAAALVVLGIINSHSQVAEAPEPVASDSHEMSPVAVATTPIIDWKTESAMLTQPLQRELEDLRSDLKKAEEKVKEDIGL
jgi:hypothetical protein